MNQRNLQASPNARARFALHPTARTFGALLVAASAGLALAGCDDDPVDAQPCVGDACDPVEPCEADDSCDPVEPCEGEGCSADPVSVTLEFVGMVGDQLLVAGDTYTGIGTGEDSELIIHDARFYISGIELANADGVYVALELDDSAWHHDGVALVDLTDSDVGSGSVQVNTTVSGTLPPGIYSGVRFVLGVPFEHNHTDTAAAPSPLNVTAMAWNWRGGRKFVRLDGVNGHGMNVMLHLGSTDCAGEIDDITGCSRPNRGVVALPTYNPEQHVIALDVARVYVNSDIDFNTPETPALCMSGANDPECGPIFEALGIDFVSGVPGETQQSVFRLVERDE